MNEIKCNAKNCGFNQNNQCKKSNVRIEGMFSRSKLGTFCQSFRNPLNQEEFAKEFNDEFREIDDHKSNICCNANYCKYNHDNYCHKETINVGSNNAKYRSETECESFELK